LIESVPSSIAVANSHGGLSAAESSTETASAMLPDARSAELTTALNIDAAKRPSPFKTAADEAQHSSFYATSDSTQ